MQSLEGKTAFITGAASGIGFALAEQAAREQMNVVLADIEEEALSRAVRMIEERQVRVLGVPVNTMLAESVSAAAERAIAEFGRVHLVFNNAGVAATRTAGKALWEIPDRDWDWVMGVNFYGVLHGIRAFVPHMLAHGEPGHIVNTASLAGVLPGYGTYGVSKHAVLALTEGLQRDFADQGANINASVLCPGMVDTHIAEAERNRPAELATETASPEREQQGKALMADLLRRGKAPSEIAEIVFRSIRENRFYILPHPAWDEFVRSRVEQILARGPVASVDMMEMQRRREAGDVF